jgi:hypothetical protein
MPNPKIAEAGRATRFKKGNVPISPGRPKKGRFREYYEELIDKRLPEDLRIGLKLEKGATYGEAIALGQARAAIKGKTDAAREIADRLEGKPTPSGRPKCKRQRQPAGGDGATLARAVRQKVSPDQTRASETAAVFRRRLTRGQAP